VNFRVGRSVSRSSRDSMAIVASKDSGLVACNGGPYLTADGAEAIKALQWEDVRRIVDRFTALNPYDTAIVPGSILNIVEDINYDSAGKQRQVASPPSVTPFTRARVQGCRSLRPASTGWASTTGRRRGATRSPMFRYGSRKAGSGFFAAPSACPATSPIGSTCP
jgi:hypothetical protein